LFLDSCTASFRAGAEIVRVLSDSTRSDSVTTDIGSSNDDEERAYGERRAP
jgi:hypothetical protein